MNFIILFYFSLRIRIFYCKSAISYHTYLFFQAEPSGRRNEQQECHSRGKMKMLEVPLESRARLKHLTCLALEDEHIDGGPSDFLLSDEGDDEDDVLVIDANEDLVREMDLLLIDLKL
jgi:hypothetical protein